MLDIMRKIGMSQTDKVVSQVFARAEPSVGTQISWFGLLQWEGGWWL